VPSVLAVKVKGQGQIGICPILVKLHYIRDYL